MTKEKFYELLDIESPADFQYFENFAAYIESDEDFEYEDVAELVKEMDKKAFYQIVNEYFEEITDYIPGSEATLYGSLETVRKAFMGMARNCEDDVMQTQLADELERFRLWYSRDSKAFVTSIETMEEQQMSLRDALVCARVENLDGNKYQYDFYDCEEYKLEEYIVSYGDMISLYDEDEEEE